MYLASTELEAQVLSEFVKIAPPEYRGQYFEAKEAKAQFDFVQESYCVGALHFPNDLTIEPRQLLRQLIPYLTEKESITYIPNTNIIEVTIEGADCVVRDARGSKWAADQVFICSGAEYRTVFPEHFVANGLIVCKLQMMETVPHARVLPHSILSGLSILRYLAFKICPSTTC